MLRSLFGTISVIHFFLQQYPWSDTAVQCGVAEASPERNDEEWIEGSSWEKKNHTWSFEELALMVQKEEFPN